MNEKIWSNFWVFGIVKAMEASTCETPVPIIKYFFITWLAFKICIHFE